MTDEQVAQDEVEFVGPGKLLQQARSRAGLTVEQVAAKLNLKPQSITDIEQEQFDQRISVTFTRGYLKAYAKQVGMDEAEVLSAFEQLNACDKEPAKLQSFSRRVANQASDDRLMLVSYVIVIAIVGLFVAWWWQQDGDSTGVQAPVLPALEQSSETAQQTEAQQVELPVIESGDAADLPVDTQPQQLVENAIDTTELDDTPSVSEAELEQLNAEAETFEAQSAAVEVAEQTAESVEPEVVEQDVVEQAEAAVETETVTADNLLAESSETQAEQVLAEPVELIFEFAADCWMQLTDATGEAIAYGVKTEGRVMPVSGVPPFEVILGAPGAVSISYAGQSIDMSQFPKGRTARFSLPLTVGEGE